MVFIVGTLAVAMFGHVFELGVQQAQASETPATENLYHLNFIQVDNTKVIAPKLASKSVILVDAESGEVLYSKAANQSRPIASISKLVTAMVLLDKGTDLAMVQTITKQDAYRSSRSRLAVGTKVTLGDLLKLSLLVSDNRAARAIARAVSGSYEEFAKEMNAKCEALGLNATLFLDPTGLDSRNVSTAEEVALLMHYASEYNLIQQITSSRTGRVKLLNSRNRARYLNLQNTNELLPRMNVVAGKTGYISAAQHCLATMIEGSKGQKLTLVVLGAPGDKRRFREAQKLAEWGFKNGEQLRLAASPPHN